MSYRGVNSEQCTPALLPGGQPKTADYSHQQEIPTFQADISFYDVRYPYWQYPFNRPIFNVVAIQAAGVYHHQSNLGKVGRPLGINDWNTVQSTPYGVLPDELQ